MTWLKCSLLLLFLIAVTLHPCYGGGDHEEEEAGGKEEEQEEEAALNMVTVAASDAIFGGGKFNASWTYSSASKTITITVKAETAGWVGFGWTEGDGKKMVNYDVAVGGRNGSSCYLNDFFSTTTGRPVLDASQDLTASSCLEDAGITTLVYSRLATTNDTTKDVQLHDDEFMTLVWAFGAADAGPTAFEEHEEGNHGYSAEKYNLVTGMKQVAAVASSVIISIITALLPVFMLFVF
ncbi:DBH-like monooxygenase protein 1 homolog isoform X2 [Nematostella vectensis]|nr:DBH-like monooxygenase protein 1 homolog isoform X2 [Nematostella vectensis]XP_048581039.1 DBH-like monooxygenase protein 1 homolog isoform X2 [Nematostella vectensis]